MGGIPDWTDGSQGDVQALAHTALSGWGYPASTCAMRSPACPSHKGGIVPFFCGMRSEEHTSELQSLRHLVCRLLLDKNIRVSAPPRQKHTLALSHPLPPRTLLYVSISISNLFSISRSPRRSAFLPTSSSFR